MGKYEPLGDYLRALQGDSWDANFTEVERILGFPLPKSARDYRAWWSNHSGGNHSQAAVWVEAGWKTSDIDLRRGMVRFETARSKDRQQAVAEDEQSIWHRAGLVSGIKDMGDLRRAAAYALIEREAARQLAQMGGTMPNADAAPRARPFG